MTSINTTFGAAFDGAIISTAMYGITCCQALRYYRTFEDDPRSLKALIAIVWLVDTLQQTFVACTFWHFLIVIRARPSLSVAGTADWSLIAQVIPTEISAGIVECYFIVRTWKFYDKKNWIFILLVPVVISILFSTGAVKFFPPRRYAYFSDNPLAYVVKCYLLPEFSDSVKFPWLVGVFGTARLVTDLAIAATMSYILYSHQKRGLTSRSVSVIRSLVHYTLTTGLLTSIFAVIYIIVYFSMPLNMIYIGVYFVHSKIYVNSMLAALNSRQYLRLIVNQSISLMPTRQNLKSPA